MLHEIDFDTIDWSKNKKDTINSKLDVLEKIAKNFIHALSEVTEINRQEKQSWEIRQKEEPKAYCRPGGISRKTPTVINVLYEPTHEETIKSWVNQQCKFDFEQSSISLYEMKKIIYKFAEPYHSYLQENEYNCLPYSTHTIERYTIKVKFAIAKPKRLTNRTEQTQYEDDITNTIEYLCKGLQGLSNVATYLPNNINYSDKDTRAQLQALSLIGLSLEKNRKLYAQKEILSQQVTSFKSSLIEMLFFP